MRTASPKILLALLMLLSSSTAFAHPGHDVSGFVAGLMHPYSGLDHLLAMVAVGLWAAQGNKKDSVGRIIWLLPATFMTMLAAGAAVALEWQGMPMIEAGIASSVLALGLLIALSVQLPAWLSIALTAVFGFFHGYAHGLELPDSVAPAEYALGFLAATASLHLTGIAAGVVTRDRYASLAKMLGVAIAAGGTYLLIGT